MTGAVLAACVTSTAIGDILVVGEFTRTTQGVPNVTTFWDGYLTSQSRDFSTTGAIGSLTPSTFNGATIISVYWTGSFSQGQVYVEVTGTRSAGFITSVRANNVSLGTIGSPSTTTHGTIFTVGPGNVANPFANGASIRVLVA